MFVLAEPCNVFGIYNGIYDTHTHTLNPTPAFPLVTPLFLYTSNHINTEASHQDAFSLHLHPRCLALFTPLNHTNTLIHAGIIPEHAPQPCTHRPEKEKGKGAGLPLLSLLLLLEPNCPA